MRRVFLVVINGLLCYDTFRLLANGTAGVHVTVELGKGAGRYLQAKSMPL